jgi:hypothetical protein
VDRAALALVLVCCAVPLGAAAAHDGKPGTLELVAGCARALAAAFGACLVCAALEPLLLVSVLCWVLPAALLGAAVARTQATAFAVSALWLGLCALPWFYHRLPQGLARALEKPALEACPWLGFAGTELYSDNERSRLIDPLRLREIYLGQWTPLTAQPAQGLLDAATVGLWAALALALALALSRIALSGKRP